jgi:hypothetical protein
LMLMIVGLFAIGTIALAAPRWQRKSELASLERRTSLDDETIYSNYYADSSLTKESVMGAWREIASALKLPSGKLRPEDRFGRNIGTYLITSDNLDTLHELGRQRAERLGFAIDFAKVTTVDEYVRALAKPL